MSIINLQNVSKSFGDQLVLQDLSLQLNHGDKLALIGENGTGKSTLLQILVGDLEPDHADAVVRIGRGAIVGYLSQLQTADSDRNALIDPEVLELENELAEVNQKLATATEPELSELLSRYVELNDRYTALDGYSIEARLAEILDGLGLPRDAAKRPLYTLSGGELMRASLAGVLVRKPDILILDEPTNHLDLLAIDWLAEYLKSYAGIVIVISHDRFFLDKFANCTARLSHGKLTVRRGNYSEFVRLEAEENARLAREMSQLEKKIERQQEITQTMLSHRKISSYHSSQKKSDRLQDRYEQLKQNKQKGDRQLNFRVVKGNNIGDPERILLQAKELNVGFDGTILWHCPEFTVRGTDHIVLVGPNGAGKTTFLKAILGDLAGNTEGTIAHAQRLNIGYLGQNVEFADETIDVLTETILRNPELTIGEARTLLAQYGFIGETVFKQIAVLSGGERSRLYLCSLLAEGPDLLILDEPTNHLDINSREILENALNHYDGAIIAISHDTYFIDKIAHRLFGFCAGELSEYRDYETYLKKLKNSRSKTAEPYHDSNVDTSPKSTATTGDDLTSSTVCEQAFDWSEFDLSYIPALKEFSTVPQNRRQQKRFTALLRQETAKLEHHIPELEERRLEYEQNFSTTDADTYREYADLLQKIEHCENLYLKILAILDELRQDDC